MRYKPRGVYVCVYLVVECKVCVGKRVSFLKMTATIAQINSLHIPLI